MSGALTLRPYQQEAVDAVQAAVRRGIQRPMVVCPTGTGKTIIFASLIAQRGGSALVLAHRDELLRQAAEKIAIADPTLALGVGFVAAQRDDVNAPVVVGSVQTLARANRLARLPRQFDTVIVDECHHASARSYRRILDHLGPSPLILGVTATPARADGKELGDVWQEIVYQRAIAEMIHAGYLTDIRGVRVGLEQVKLDQVDAVRRGLRRGRARTGARAGLGAPPRADRLPAARHRTQGDRVSARPCRSRTVWPACSGRLGSEPRRSTEKLRGSSDAGSSRGCTPERRGWSPMSACCPKAWTCRQSTR